MSMESTRSPNDAAPVGALGEPAHPGVDGRYGLAATITAFLLWGALPLYLRPLRAVAPLAVMSHRIVWCCGFVLAWLALRGGLGEVVRALRSPPTRGRLALSALLISGNWLGFVWAVSVGRVLDASLGYFMNPIVNVLLGVTLLGERLRRGQWAAVALAALGVLWLGMQAGELPWVALLLAFSFGGYGLVRKVVAVEAVAGLAAETIVLSPLALAYLAWAHARGSTGLAPDDTFLKLWLVLGGLVTAIPLALFSYGARRIPLSTVGLVQYLAPTLQFLSGVVLFGEPLPRSRMVGFALIWTALVVYAADGLAYARRPR